MLKVLNRIKHICLPVCQSVCQLQSLFPGICQSHNCESRHVISELYSLLRQYIYPPGVSPQHGVNEKTAPHDVIGLQHLRLTEDLCTENIAQREHNSCRVTYHKYDCSLKLNTFHSQTNHAK